MKRYRKITLRFLIYALAVGFFLINFCEDPIGNKSPDFTTGLWIYGCNLLVGGGIFFFVNMFIKRFNVRLMWLCLLAIPQYIFGVSFVGSSWPLFGEPSYMYKFTPLGMILFFGTEILYLYLMRKEDRHGT